MGENRVVGGTAEDTLSDMYLIFPLGKDSFGIPVRFVTEIIGIQKIISVPDLPESVKGIINLRGKVIPVMDLRVRFKKEEIPYTERTCIVIAEVQDLSMGIIVDSVSEVLTIPPENSMDPPQITVGSESRFIKKIGRVEDQIILLLDCENIVFKINLETDKGEKTA